MKSLALILWCLLTYIEGRRQSQSKYYNYSKKVSLPDHAKLVPKARYLLHNAEWAYVATISSIPEFSGLAYTSVEAMVDGTWANSTGVPYFYLSVFDWTFRDLKRNNRASILVFLEDVRYCENQNAENERCNKLILFGKMKKVKPGSGEYIFAQTALKERHPAINGITDYDMYFIAKLKITLIAIINRYGEINYVRIHDYFTYQYSGTEMDEFDNRFKKKKQFL